MGTLGLGDGSLRMDDVYLEGATPDGTAVVGHLSVIVDAEGMTVLGPDPGARRTVGWDRMSSMEFGPSATLPGGRPGTSLQFDLDGRPLRLLVPVPGHPAGEDAPTDDGPTEPVITGPVITGPVMTEPEVVAESVIVTAATPVAADPLVPVEPVVLSAADSVMVEVAPPAAAPSVPPPPPPAVLEPALVSRPEAAVGDGVVDSSTDDDEGSPPPPRTLSRVAARRVRPVPRMVFPPAERIRRLALVTILVGLLPMAAGVWYFHLQESPSRAPGTSLPDTAMAARVGIQKADLVGWSAAATQMGNPFAAGATTSGAAATTADAASAVLARCLHVSVAALDGAFGMGSSVAQRTAEVSSPSFADPGGNGGSVSSVVDVMASGQVQQADAAVFSDPALFATCYQPYVQAMLPYAASDGGSAFATATVQPVVVPVAVGPDGFQVAAFQIARIANDNGQTTTVVTTAIAVSGGRVQATLGTVDNFVFPLDVENQLVRNTEVRVIGVSQL